MCTNYFPVGLPPAQSEDSDAAPAREEEKPMKAAKFVSTLPAVSVLFALCCSLLL